MKKNAKYVVVRYVPDLDRKEMINVGVILHVPSLQFLDSKFTTNYSRISKFDDELDKDFLKIYLTTLKDEFTYNIEYLNEGLELSNENLLEKLSMNYVNQFVFEIKTIVLNKNPKSTFENLCKIMLYYDYDKSHRIKINDKKEFLKSIFLSNSIDFETVKRNSIQGYYDENINPDFIVNNLYLKFLNFNESNYQRQLEKVKAWAFNAIELEKKNIKVVFIVNDYVGNNQTDKYFRMLNDYASVYQSIEDPELMNILQERSSLS